MLGLTIIVILYLSLIGYLGYRGYRGTKTAADYLVAGRQIHPFVMALSYGATFISTSAIVGFGGAAAVFGMGILWLTVLNIFVGIFIAFIFLGGRTRAMGHHLGAHTFPELLGKRLQSRFLQAFSGMVIVVLMPLYTGAVLIGAAKFIEIRLNVSYEAALFFFSTIVALYVIMGGLKGVMYTDAMQGFIMLFGMTLLIILVYTQLGGPLAAHRSLTEMAAEAAPVFGRGGHQGWTAMPSFGSPMWWTLVSTIVMGVGIGVLAQPQLAVRYMTVKSGRELNRAVFVGGVFILMMTGVAFVVGALSNVFFFQSPEFGQIAFLAAGKVTDSIIPIFIRNFTPWWFGDIFMVTLLAAAMSTVSSQFHAMGTAAGRDVFENLRRVSASSRSIAASRVGILLTFIVSVFLAYYLPRLFEGTGTAIIANSTAIFFGVCAATFLPMYVGSLYWRRLTKTGAISGATVGFFASMFWLLFVHIKESGSIGLCQLIFGKASLLEGVVSGPFIWQEVDPLFVAFPLSVIITIVVSLLTKPYAREHLDDCFSRIR